MQRATIIFLVLLRLAIGWHFLYEGLLKVRSVYVGETATNRPFSSAAYFREAPGPLGPLMRRTIGDVDEETLARLTIVPRDAAADPAADKAHDRAPPALRKRWEAFVQAYGQHYDFDQQQQQAADVKLKHALATVVGWLEYRPAPVLDEVRARFGRLDNVEVASLSDKEKHAYQAYLDNTAEVTLNAGDVKLGPPLEKLTRRLTASQRVALYRRALADLREYNRTRPAAFGKDVDGRRGRDAVKKEVADLRRSLLADLDGHGNALIAALNQVAAGPEGAAFDRLGGLREKAEKDKLAEKAKGTPAAEPLAALLTSLTAVETGTEAMRPMKPADAGKRAVRPLDGKAMKPVLTRAVELVGKSTDLVRQAAPPAEVAAFADEVARVTPSARKAVDRLPEKDALQPATGNEMLERIDWATRWGLTVMGACLLIGLFTRLNCVLGAGFLLMTYLLVPAFPWLPAVGPSEGNYLFVNKNVVEMLALLALATTPSGRWFGVDAVFHRVGVMIFGEKQATTSPER